MVTSPNGCKRKKRNEMMKISSYLTMLAVTCSVSMSAYEIDPATQLLFSANAPVQSAVHTAIGKDAAGKLLYVENVDGKPCVSTTPSLLVKGKNNKTLGGYTLKLGSKYLVCNDKGLVYFSTDKNKEFFWTVATVGDINTYTSAHKDGKDVVFDLFTQLLAKKVK
jgi:hypothetical protein